MEIGRPFRDPFDKAGHLGMALQCLHGVIGVRKFSFAEHTVYFLVADRMYPDGLPPAFRFGNQVVFLGPGAQGPETNRTDIFAHPDWIQERARTR